MEMKLKNKPFNRIKNGQKTIEMRLFDEKRSKIKVGEEIIFTNLENGEKITCVVQSLHIFKNFHDLYSFFDKIEIGYALNEEAKSEDMEEYYPLDEQKKFGVVGIKIKLKD